MPTQETTAQYFSAKRAAHAGRRISHIALTEGGIPLWVESVPEEKGRFRLCTLQDQEVREIGPQGMNVRSRFREYGGGEFAIEGQLIVGAGADGGIWWQSGPSFGWVPLGDSRTRYGDFAIRPATRTIIAVEEVADAVGSEKQERLVMLELDTGTRTVLWDHADFVAAPRFNSNGTKLVWKSWRYPHMPWDECMLWCAVIGSEGLNDVKALYDQPGYSVCQSEWGRNGVLRAVIESNHYWVLAAYRDGSWQECGAGGVEWGRPEWVPGIRTFGVNDQDKIIASVCDRGRFSLISLDESEGAVRSLALPFTEIQNIAVSGQALLVSGGGAMLPSSLYLYERRGNQYALQWTRESNQPNAVASAPQLYEYSTEDGLRLNAWLYLPQESEGGAPPVVVKVHGGPTGCAQSALDLRYQFWTSRGFAIVDLNYRGSSGFGRTVRDALYGRAGESEVSDCEALLAKLIREGLVSKDGCFISGSSAGGFVALAAAMQSDLFCGAAVYYGISDVAQLMQATPAFERGYLQRLFGASERWEKVSPGKSKGLPRCAVLLVHGEDDRIVPIEQSRMMARRIHEAGGTAQLIELPGEGHGVRNAENIERCLIAEHAFFMNQIKDRGTQIKG